MLKKNGGACLPCAHLGLSACEKKQPTTSSRRHVKVSYCFMDRMPVPCPQDNIVLPRPLALIHRIHLEKSKNEFLFKNALSKMQIPADRERMAAPQSVESNNYYWLL